MNIKQTLKNLNILYAEDDKLIRKYTAKILNLFFDKVFEANNGAEALKIYHKETVHVLFLDYMMPCMDGYALAKEIRLLNPNIPIIICSGYTDIEKLHNAIDLGVINYIEKPLKYEELLSSLESCVDTLKSQNLLKMKITPKLSYDYINKVIEKENQNISLTLKQIKLLELLIKQKSQLVSFEMIKDEVFNNEDIELNTLRNLVYKLRKILEDDKIIITVKDFGYILVL